MDQKKKKRIGSNESDLGSETEDQNAVKSWIIHIIQITLIFLKNKIEIKNLKKQNNYFQHFLQNLLQRFLQFSTLTIQFIIQLQKF